MVVRGRDQAVRDERLCGRVDVGKPAVRRRTSTSAARSSEIVTVLLIDPFYHIRKAVWSAMQRPASGAHDRDFRATIRCQR